MPYSNSDNSSAAPQGHPQGRRLAALRLSEQQRENREEKDIQTGGLLGALIGGVIGSVVAPGAGTSIGASVGRKAGEIAGGRDPELSDLIPAADALGKKMGKKEGSKADEPPEFSEAFLSILPSLLSKGA